MLFHAKRENKIKYFYAFSAGSAAYLCFFALSQMFFGQFMFFWPKIKYFYAFFICFFGAKRRPFLSIFCMLFSPRSGEKIFMHFLYAFRAKREKKIYHFLSIYVFLTKPIKKHWSPPTCEASSRLRVNAIGMALLLRRV